MPLFAVGDSDKQVTTVPHRDDFKRWIDRLDKSEQQAIRDELDRLIDRKVESGEDIVTSSWMPSELCPNGGDDWDGTPFQVIWDKACLQSWDQTAQCFGLFVWERMMDRAEAWHFMRCELDGDAIGGMTYFRCQQDH
jgi:hypothetical protein